MPAQQASNFVYLRTAPDDSAPLFGDQAIHGTAAGTNRINDWGSTAQAGQQFVVAGVQGDWTAIWFSGAKVWFHNPDGKNAKTATGVKIIRRGTFGNTFGPISMPNARPVKTEPNRMPYPALPAPNVAT